VTAPRKPSDSGDSSQPSRSIANTRPDPDPTLLTTDNLRREVSGLKELLSTRIDAYGQVMDVYRDTIEHDRSTTIQLNRAAVLEERVKALESLMEEKFLKVGLQIEETRSSTQLQIRERDVRTDKTAGDAFTAVQAAFSAQKEAASKSEDNITKYIDNMMILINQSKQGNDDRFNAASKYNDDRYSEIRERLTAIEARASFPAQSFPSSTNQSANPTVLLGIALAVLLGLAALVVVIVKH
jgi:hypothetical protein